ncbi:DNA polymerase III subunit alpha [Candidatus Neptunochlamydia vexilliferae]|uniref:DNA polymerase III subunit alpha n=1 Tax=Candidatus Neptunichlamydia vexilliferae TaxID=1651774 RepID=UPI001891D242|nr:DNA polymerase III subunit alpha [Candidatus Neptunochlamydia vexilliferae]
MVWIPLHLHSQYSILDSTASVQALVEKGASYGMHSLALTDFCNLFGAVDFFKACKKGGIKPIIGCEVMVAPVSRTDKKRLSGHSVAYPLILLAKDQEGYRNLCKISSIGYLEGFYYTPRVDKEILEKYSGGLIALSGPIQSRISQWIIQERDEELEEELVWSKKVYGEDFYFELQRHQMSDEHIHAEGIEKESWLYQYYLDRVKNQTKVNEKLLSLSKERGIPCVATNDTHYIDREDWRAHEILMNVQSGEPVEIIERDSFGNPRGRDLNPKRKVVPTHELYFKSPQEMEALFADVPEALTNSEKIAGLCNVEIDFKTRFYPVFVPPYLEGTEFDEKTREEASAAFLRKLCEEGISKRYTPERLEKVQEKYPDQEPLEVVKQRLEGELEIIISKGMCDYLLIVYDFIAWAKGEGIPVGPGRGSGAGSIILYLIGITDIEPLRFNLFFERFINPERMSYPDIDVDICMDRRSEVIDYTLKKYGKEKVAQIITFGTMKAKMAIKDVGRVLSVPLAKVNEIAKLVPEDPTMTLKRAFELDPELRAMAEHDEDGKRILEYAKRLEGSIRNTGIHAAGLIICGDPLTDHIPICNAKDSEMAVTQYSMKPVEAVGMLKIDFLGLKTLTSIQKTVDAIEERGSEKIDWVDLPLEDQTTFNLLNQGKTGGVFQLESTGMQELAKHLHIDKFEEIIAVGALYRPGPMEMIPSFINRKHGREKIEIDHPAMKDVIAETYGIMVYQEQVMQIASLLAGYSLGEGDVLRRAMGKKDREEMAKQREKFRTGAIEKGIDENLSMEIFDKIEKFASYGFNKSHAAAYGYLSYVTAYLKANYPKEWLAALMTCDSDDLTKVAKHIRECEAMGIKILPPDVNESGTEFAAAPSGIRFAMSGVKGVGRGVVESILIERKQSGPYKSFYDFFKRIDLTKVGKKVIEHLVDAGSFDFTGWTRQELLEGVEPMFEQTLREQKEKAKGVIDFFSLLEDETNHAFLEPPKVMRQQEKKEILAKEKELLGFYLTGHPMEEYRPLVEKLGCQAFHEFEAGSVVKTAFIIESVAVKVSKKTGKKFAILMISDGVEHFELPIWSEMYESNTLLFIEGQLLFAILQLDKDDDAIKLRCRLLEDLTLIKEDNIAQLDTLHEQFKKRAKSDARWEKKKPAEVVMDKKLNLTLDVNQVRLSQIVKLKKLFQRYPGAASVYIAFNHGERKVGAVEVESKWGVGWSPEVENHLKSFSFIETFSFEG